MSLRGLLGKKAPYDVDASAAIDIWGDTVLRTAHRYLGNLPDAEDVFQTVFMRLVSSKTSFADEEHLKAWLLRVTINCCYDVLRKRKPTVGIEEADGLEDRSEAGTVEGSALEAAIEALSPPIRRVVIHLYYFEGYSTDEIAQITGENPSTVRSHLRRARAALKITLEGAHDARG